jgi:hypothetical protein
MNYTDRILDSVRWEVEFNGQSHADCVFLNDLSFTIDRHKYEVPSEANPLEARADVYWFFASAREGRVAPHQDPDASFWLRIFGEDANPYGYTWNLPRLLENIHSPTAWRRAILYNPMVANNPPCVLCYQFHPTLDVLSITATMRSSDVYKVLPQDIVMTDLILREIARKSELQPGDITFNIGNAHAFYEDMEYVEEDILDWGD